jgi:hypothetical protein
MVKTKRCPNGTRKNKDGDCVKKEESKEKQKRCPRGTHKNKDGNCEQFNRTYESTPRTKYAKQFFKKEDIYLANKNFKSKESNPLLFQLSFHDVKQFKDYANLSKNPNLDCVYQALFSLGLREVKQAKKEAAYVNKFGKRGVMLSELKKYISTTFGIDAERVRSKVFRDMPETNVTNFLYETLNDNHATILFLNFEDYTGVTQYVHCIIAYRYNYDIIYFNPQGRGLDREHKVQSMNLLHLVPDVLSIQSALLFTIEDLDSPKKARHVDCQIGALG